MNNKIEKAIDVERPKVILREEYQMYVPVATNTSPGIASFDSAVFSVKNGVVKLNGKYDSFLAVKDISFDVDTGLCTIQYTDGGSKQLRYDVGTSVVNVSSLLTKLEFTPASFRYNDLDGQWYAIWSTNLDLDNYVIYYEVSTKETLLGTEYTGYSNVLDSVFRTADGLIAICVPTEEIKNTMTGRLLLLGGSIVKDSQIANITYNENTGVLTFNKIDGTNDTVMVIDKTYADEKYVSSVRFTTDDNYVLTIDLLNTKGDVLSTGRINLPLESVIQNVSYSSVDHKLYITLVDGSSSTIDVADLTTNLVTYEDFNKTIGSIHTTLNIRLDELKREILAEAANYDKDVKAYSLALAESNLASINDLSARVNELDDSIPKTPKYYHDVNILINRNIYISNNAYNGLFIPFTIFGEITLSFIDSNPLPYDCMETGKKAGTKNSLFDGLTTHFISTDITDINAQGKILVDERVWNINAGVYDNVRTLRYLTNRIRFIKTDDDASPYKGIHLWVTSFATDTLRTSDKADVALRPLVDFLLYDPKTETAVSDPAAYYSGYVVLLDYDTVPVQNPTTTDDYKNYQDLSTITVGNVTDRVTPIL